MDYSIAHALDRFSARHDAFEDGLGGYVSASEALFAGVLVALFLLIPGRWRRTGQGAAVAGLAAFLVAALIAHFVGLAVGRDRPFVAHPRSITAFLPHAADASFPSDHATASFAIATAVLFRHRWWGAVLLALAAVTAVGRVFLGLHYPTDVIAGAALGAAVGSALSLAPARRWLDGTARAVAQPLDRALGRVAGRAQG